MSAPKKRPAYQLGVNRAEPARRWRKTANNFKLSCDAREDRSTRERKLRMAAGTLPALEASLRAAKKANHARPSRTTHP
jgi:hypothetical protein